MSYTQTFFMVEVAAEELLVGRNYLNLALQ